MGDMEPTRRVDVSRSEAAGVHAAQDAVVVEEPLEIRTGKTSVVVIMRTPGHDEELAAGFLVTENVIRRCGDVEEIFHCDEPGAQQTSGNVLVVKLADTASVDLERLRRNFYATSSCGLCGKASIDSVRQYAPPIEGRPVVDRAVLCDLPRRMRAAQHVFAATGGLHAAGLFDATGRLLCLREDVGRHNAVDKVVGWAVLEDRLPLRETILLVSGRASFEIVQKALVAGVPVVGAVSAATSLAVDLARESNMTLMGFIRDERFVVYAGPDIPAGP